MNYDVLQPAILSLANERTLGGVLGTIVESLSQQDNVALARIWLIDQGTPCDDDAGDGTELELAASDGRSLDTSIDPWRNLEGRFRRFKLGERKIGEIAESGEPIFLTNLDDDNSWLKDPDWAASSTVFSTASAMLLRLGRPSFIDASSSAGTAWALLAA